MKYVIKFFSEITIKSRPVRKRFVAQLADNLKAVLKELDAQVQVKKGWDKLEVDTAVEDPLLLAQMVEAIVRDKKRLIPCAAYCQKEYNVGGYYVGVPVILGTGGVERIIELDLTSDEQAAFEKSVAAVKELVTTMAGLV